MPQAYKQIALTRGFSQRKYTYMHRSQTPHNARYRYTYAVQIGASTLFVYKACDIVIVQNFAILAFGIES